MNRTVILVVTLILSACATTTTHTAAASPPEGVTELVELATANNKEEGDDALRAIATYFSRRASDGWILRLPTTRERERLALCKCHCGYLILARQDQRWQVTLTGSESPSIFPLE